METQRIVLPARVTSFRVVCATCQARQPESRGYVGAIVVGELPRNHDHGTVTCRRGHAIELVRESPAVALR